MPNKNDFAVKLLEEGLATTFVPGNARKPGNFNAYTQAQANAKSKEIGIWGSSLKGLSNATGGSKDSSLVGDGKKFQVNQRVKVEMTELVDATSFYLRRMDQQATSVDEAMDQFDPNTAEMLEKPIKKDTLCAALFAEDNTWYRVKVLGSRPGDKAEVQFVDFGNVTTVKIDSDLRKLPAHMLAFES
jgi:hypothetical protein